MGTSSVRGHRRRSQLYTCVAIVGVVSAVTAWCSAGAAGAAVTSFAMSPTSGPPGTVVQVSGTGCTPGLLASLSTDFVAVTAATLDLAQRAPVASNGSWHATFTVPAGGLPAGTSAPVAAVCVSSGLQSLLTIYSPQQFSVTAASTTSTIAPSDPGVTTPNPPTGGSGGAVPPTTTRAPKTTSHDPGSPVTTIGPSVTASLPGGGGGTTPGSSTTGSPNAGSSNGGSNGGSAGTGGGSGDVAVGKKHTDSVRAATLQAPDLGASLAADRTPGSGGLGWLGWLLLLALALGVVGAATCLWRSRRLPEAAGSGGEPA